MKKLILAALLLASCAKDPLSIQIWQSYHIKSNIFNQGTWQPVQPVVVNTLYIDPASGLPYASVSDQKGIVWYIPQTDLK